MKSLNEEKPRETMRIWARSWRYWSKMTKQGFGETSARLSLKKAIEWRDKSKEMP